MAAIIGLASAFAIAAASALFVGSPQLFKHGRSADMVLLPTFECSVEWLYIVLYKHAFASSDLEQVTNHCD